VRTRRGESSSAEEQLALSLAAIEKQLGGEVKSLMTAAAAALGQEGRGGEGALAAAIDPLRHAGAAMQHATDALGHVLASATNTK
jgi:hypothetical protein